ncbi:MAG: carboxypeptidase-like regulatory domain-containing protein, partial [Acidobacteriaceae bacterium]
MRLFSRSATLSLLLSGLFLALAAPLFAQVVGGTISGTVKDRSGAALPRASVAILNQETGSTRHLVTGVDGTFSAPSLPIGSYSVQVNA